MYHTPVLLSEALHYLLHDGSRLILDATVGSGGHAKAILDARGNVTVIGIDRDAMALEVAAERLKEYSGRVFFFMGAYTELDSALGSRGNVDGVLVDHGMSSLQLEDSHRGFSYSGEGPLDMRMSGTGQTASDLIESTDMAGLACVLERYGEVARPRRIARSIKNASQKHMMRTTADLKAAVENAFGRRVSPGLLSRIFQAFRIAVNRELELLQEFLGSILRYVNRNGRLVFISYHSLEDRMIKEFLRRESAECICPPGTPVCVCGRRPALELLTKKAIKTANEEIARNPRARSARLRAARVI
ncbi:MAG: 16S rRNA (cytosine(1402)-N(4))-methyltransferase RsmH [Candidatus Latescibacteria bacterium]|nr:16S rRNA (cytosine(1402)-N(4))-methyltransferase RsmH [Candidatus Latescibacterota bacterium]NIM21080.1 16S rRNA (cytosine(1402)-N(4))-methyltransferase RsmH [Candidatus Latescibacterota bacterium]NIM65215.1 16S rRNA (cytosine(1402)-N(4))-methyltransferase RsmH [Candidatus Latescibacterota bacterium]NIO01730.1 16S rRNA (cytosine(1402)-N(4))-methyltransferase RsmH [Candidatus Latescibacterota bacterium]NIO28247.1 16S rRNA (cytosine(1402)-N(4))-methyltransferase RsmH [Candidatus Latescibactero